MPRDVATAGPAVPLLSALASALGVLGLWAAFVLTARGQVVDEVAFEGSHRGRDLLDDQAATVLSVVSEGTLAVGVVLVVVVAVLRRHVPLAVAAVAVVGGSNISTQVLKHVVLPRPDLGLGAANSLPSGHTTVAASLAVALVLVLPPAARGSAAVLAAVYTAATGVSTLVAGWHRPSDVVAALLVVAAWTGLAVALLGALSVRDVRGGGRRALAVLAAVGLLGVVVGVAATAAAALALDAAGTVVVASAAREAGRTVQLLSYGGGTLVSAGGSALLLAGALASLRRAPG